VATAAPASRDLQFKPGYGLRVGDGDGRVEPDPLRVPLPVLLPSRWSLSRSGVGDVRGDIPGDGDVPGEGDIPGEGDVIGDPAWSSEGEAVAPPVVTEEAVGLVAGLADVGDEEVSVLVLLSVAHAPKKSAAPMSSVALKVVNVFFVFLMDSSILSFTVGLLFGHYCGVSCLLAQIRSRADGRRRRG
jgi:hypothetical protein